MLMMQSNGLFLEAPQSLELGNAYFCSENAFLFLELKENVNT